MRELQRSYQQARTKIELWGLSHEARALIDSVEGKENPEKGKMREKKQGGHEREVSTKSASSQ